jgi:DNA-binding transcriptional ArsR family regulator
MKSYRNLERVVKGFANHRRIEIMTLVDKTPELSVFEIADRLKINFKTASEHIRRLSIAGLMLKRNEGSTVRHALSPAGKNILKFLRILE